VPIPIRSSGELVATVECARATSVATQGQPWFYPRLVAYGYFWLSEGA
jgi:hypothetical protein